MSPIIETRGLTLRTPSQSHSRSRSKSDSPSQTLVRELHWRARVGERWCVIGRNAAGKSTLLRALAGLPVPQRDGEVRWLGRPQSQWPAADAAAVRAFAPQHVGDRFPIRVSRLLALCVVVPSRHDVAATLAALDASALAEREVTRLSGGERQRIALAQCALQGAASMLMDEPVAFQDPAHQMQVARWLRTLDDAALVISAHDVNWIASVATHVLALHGDGGHSQGPVGAMLEAGTLERVYGCAWRQVGDLWVAA
jgi:iron complex transport system ATP-binding protein